MQTPILRDNMNRLLFVLALLFLTTGICNASNSNQPAMDLLLKAKEVSQNASYKAERSVRETPGKSFIHYQKKSKDGKTLLLRRDVMFNGRMHEAKIRNESGWYLIYNNIASKDEYANFDWSPGQLVPTEIVPGMKTAIYSATLLGIPCYKITLQYPNDVKTLAALAGCSEQYAEENKERLAANHCGLYSFIIGKKDFFIYSTQSFDAGGKIDYELTFEKIDFNTALPDSLFQIPDDMLKGKTFQTEEEFNKAFDVTESIWKRAGKSIGDFFSRNADSLLRNGGIITFWLAVAAAILAVILKIRAKRLMK